VADPTRRHVEVGADGITFSARMRLDTRREADYYRHGGVLPYVLRSLLGPSN
jgi:aconitase A